MLPDFLQNDYSNYKRTPNSFQRFHKIINFSLSLLKTYTAIIYCLFRYTEIKNKRIEKYIFENFQRPTEGAWFSFLEILLSSRFDNNNDPKKYLQMKINEDSYRLFINQYKISLNLNENSIMKNSIFDIFQKIITLKNRLISHGIITEDLATKLNPVLEKVIDEIIRCTNNLLKINLYLIANENNDSWSVHSFYGDEQIELDTSNLTNGGLYYLINNKLVEIWPLMTCRDGNILFYNRFDTNSKKIYFTNSLNRETYIRSDVLNQSELFGFDIDSIRRKPLNIQVKQDNNVIHNLPEKDYAIFIGRKHEIAQLDIALNHPRHFISALDGIGGVGKSAIAIECCNRIIKENNNNMGIYLTQEMAL